MWTNNQLRILINEIRKITNATTVFSGTETIFLEKGIYKNQSLLGIPYSGKHCKEKFSKNSETTRDLNTGRDCQSPPPPNVTQAFF
ncbi:unnamed protein product [Rhizophagus irregularis]|nr:unnamed protein product [Rhizophagus irregularis]